MFSDTINHTLHGKNIVHMTQGSNSLHFFYDASNKPAIVDFNGTKYAYVHNLQGDIVAIFDSNGNKVVEYKYDAWGKPISKTGSMKDGLGTLNPFRYRGYVYDEETGLYYLRSRYYTHQLVKFLNADILLDDGAGFTKHNQFVYSSNNPIMFVDEDGTCERAWAAGIQGPCPGVGRKGCFDTPYFNCYAYAMQETEWKHLQIVGAFNIENAHKALMKENKSRGIRPLDSVDASIGDNEYRIAMAVGRHRIDGIMIEDYHFMIQAEDGSWSHKPGEQPIIYLEEGVTPDDITWDIYYQDGSVAMEGFYSSPIKYYAVTKNNTAN